MPEGRLRPHVLIVEDDAANRALLTHLLARSGYEATAVGDGHDGLRAAIEEAPDLLLLDVELPGMNGLDVCRALRLDPRTVTLPVILLTGRSGLEDVVAGLDAGADDFLAKPYHQAELMARVRSVLRLADARAQVDGAHGVIAALANAVEAKDAVTEQHCQRLASISQRLGVSIGLEATALRALTFGALLHDIGKIGVSDAILTKAGPLTADEWTEMRRHPLIGQRICEPLAMSRAFTPIIRNHHERWDGNGYPDRLRGESIPIGARNVGIVDAFDAMIHDRPYRAGRTPEEATTVLRKETGKQFDPGLVPAFLSVIDAIDSDVDRVPGRVLKTMRLAV
jgi:putative two-component system response regulator